MAHVYALPKDSSWKEGCVSLAMSTVGTVPMGRWLPTVSLVSKGFWL